MDRRTFLSLTTASIAASLHPGSWARLLEQSGSVATDRSLILLWLDGGLSHLDSFDPKPEAPSFIRGDLKAIPTSIDGVRLSEPLQGIASMLKHGCLIRSLTGIDGQHDRASHAVLTGHRPSAVLTYPSMGAISSRVSEDGSLPAYVAIPDAHPYARQGFLRPETAPYELGYNPAKRGNEQDRLTPSSRIEARLRLIETLDRLDGLPRSRDEEARDHGLARAREMTTNSSARDAFNLDDEDIETRERYGRHRLGQSCLLARRLAEAGVRTILVRDTGWDHHQRITRALTYGFPPKLEALDQAVSALSHDLRTRETSQAITVLVASEFGRTPRINPRGGRDHWPRAQSVLLFGEGIRPGVVYGNTDARGEEPASSPVTPGDLFATLLTAMGHDPGHMLETEDGRPIPLAPRGSRVFHDWLVG